MLPGVSASRQPQEWLNDTGPTLCRPFGTHRFPTSSEGCGPIPAWSQNNWYGWSAVSAAPAIFVQSATRVYNLLSEEIIHSDHEHIIGDASDLESDERAFPLAVMRFCICLASKVSPPAKLPKGCRTVETIVEWLYESMVGPTISS